MATTATKRKAKSRHELAKELDALPGISLRGIVTVTWFGDRIALAARVSRRRRRSRPIIERLRSQPLEGPPVQKMTLVVECVVSGGVDGQESLSCAG